MHAIYKHLKAYLLVYFGLVIYLLFYISVFKTGWFDIFFSGAALHAGAKGIDFYQIPKGAWAFLHGGGLDGNLPAGVPAYAPQDFSNGNVYHPLFSLVLGSLLALFEPEGLPYLWLWMKLFVSLAVIGFFFWSFRASKYRNFAVFVLLANFSIYLELAAWQFQFLLNIFLLLLLIALTKKRSVLWSGIWYWLGLLVKPVGILLAPALILKGRWKIALLGIWLFFLSTVLFILHGTGNYYITNLMATFSSSGDVGPNQIIAFAALLHYTTHWPTLAYQAIKDSCLLIVVLLSSFRRTHIAKAAFLAVVYYLYFYESVFEYQWSTLAYVIAVCIVTCPEFQTKRAIFCILLTCLPDCFSLLNLWHIDVKDLGYLGLIPGPTAWEWMVLSKIVPLFLLLLTVLSADIKPIFKETKTFWKEMRKVNQRLAVFGENKDDMPESEAEAEKAADSDLEKVPEASQEIVTAP
ncbi:MAG TPA: hypothetical protein VGD98_21820 [Ktedonobacteraceae bacterium]